MIVLLMAVLLAVFLLPNAWARWVLKRHSQERDDYPGTGAELAEHLIRRFGLDGVSVERTEQGDHYDPQTRCVRLSPEVHDGRSLTAVTVAAHGWGMRSSITRATRRCWLDPVWWRWRSVPRRSAHC